MELKRFEDLTQRDDFLFYHLMRQSDVLHVLLRELIPGASDQDLVYQLDEASAFQLKAAFARLMKDDGSMACGCMICCAQPNDHIGLMLDVSLALLISEYVALGTLDDRSKLWQIIIMPDGCRLLKEGPRRAMEIVQYKLKCRHISGPYTEEIKAEEERFLAEYNKNQPHIIHLCTDYEECNVTPNVAAFLDFLAGKECDNPFARRLKELTDQLKGSAKLAKDYERWCRSVRGNQI